MQSFGVLAWIFQLNWHTVARSYSCTDIAKHNIMNQTALMQLRYPIYLSLMEDLLLACAEDNWRFYIWSI